MHDPDKNMRRVKKTLDENVYIINIYFICKYNFVSSSSTIVHSLLSIIHWMSVQTGQLMNLIECEYTHISSVSITNIQLDKAFIQFLVNWN